MVSKKSKSNTQGESFGIYNLPGIQTYWVHHLEILNVKDTKPVLPIKCRSLWYFEIPSKFTIHFTDYAWRLNAWSDHLIFHFTYYF